VFASRPELLPDGDTVEEHQACAKDEAEILATDKANEDPETGGIFQGRFNPNRIRRRRPVHDAGDGVDRCPRCLWEMEDEELCLHCGYGNGDVEVETNSDMSSDISENEVDFEVDQLEDEEALFGTDGADDFSDGYGYGDEALAEMLEQRHGNPVMGHEALGDGTSVDSDESEHEMVDHRRHLFNHGRATGTRRGGRQAIDLVSSSEMSSDDEGDDLRDFIDEDEEGDAELQANIMRPQPGSTRRLHRRPPVLVSDDDDSSTVSAGASEGDGSDSEEEDPPVRGSQRSKRPNVSMRHRRAMTISSSEDEDSEGTAGPDGVENQSQVTDYDEEGSEDHDPASTEFPEHSEGADSENDSEGFGVAGFSDQEQEEHWYAYGSNI